MTLKKLLEFTRTKPDGNTGIGPGFALLVVAIILFASLYMMFVKKPVVVVDRTVKVRTETSSGVRRGNDNPVDQPLLIKNSLPDTDNTPKSTLLSLDTAFHQSSVAVKTNSLKDGWLPTVGDHMPMDQSTDHTITTDPMLSPKTTTYTATHPEESHAYRFVDNLLTIAEPIVPPASKTNGFQLHKFLPRGHKIPIILVSKINTSVGQSMAELAIAQDVYFNGRLQLPFGWRIYGTASRGANHKVHVSVNTMVDPLGREYPMTGLVCNLEQEPGLDGYPTESPLWLSMLPIMQNSIGTFLDSIKDTTSQSTLVSSGSSSNLVSQQTVYALNAKNNLIDGTSQILVGLTAQKAKELALLYPDGDIVPKGTLGFIILNTPMDLTLGEVGGSAKFLTSDVSTPSPETISLKQQQQGVQLPMLNNSISPGYMGGYGGTPAAGTGSSTLNSVLQSGVLNNIPGVGSVAKQLE